MGRHVRPSATFRSASACIHPSSNAIWAGKKSSLCMLHMYPLHEKALPAKVQGVLLTGLPTRTPRCMRLDVRYAGDISVQVTTVYGCNPLLTYGPPNASPTKQDPGCTHRTPLHKAQLLHSHVKRQAALGHMKPFPKPYTRNLAANQPS